MPNGKPGDHPLTDILVHKRRSFSRETDSLIAEIVRLGGRKELESKFNFFSPPPIPEFEKSLREMRERLLREAKEIG
jgi:hypothetical protein